MSSIRYRIYPSLLDKFQALLDVDQTVEEFWNLDSEGDYKETADEMSDRLEKELLDCINRVPHEPIEAADKGTCFNEVIDCLIADKKCEREDMFIRSDYMGENRVIIATLNGFEFVYDAAMCVEFADAYNKPISQHRCEANISTRYGDVELYGYADEIEEDVVYDIKTTGRYDFGKYAKGWQRHVYPYCLVKSGELTDVSTFVFDVVVWSGGSTRNPVLGGKFYRETYDFHYEQSELAIRQIVERFIEWLEAHREQITDKKIFGGENDEKPTLAEKPALIEKHGVMTKEEFKALWEANDEGSGLTNDDVADNAKAWGLCDRPRCMRIADVRYMVLKAAGCFDAESYKPEDWED